MSQAPFRCVLHPTPTCRWQTSNGIRFGTRLTELEERNGGPFTISGFGYNYGGNVMPELILCQHEEIAVGMAHGFAKASHKPMAAISMKGGPVQPTAP